MKRYKKLEKGVPKNVHLFLIARMKKHIPLSSPYFPPKFKIKIKKKTK